jgi:dihydrofolate reductase
VAEQCVSDTCNARNPDPADWNTTVVREVVPADIVALKEQPGGDLVLGGARLAGTFRQHDLVDEYWIYMQPVLLGGGHRLFHPARDKHPLRLAETRVFGSGVVLLRYERRS